MNAPSDPDDVLLRRYREASALEGGAPDARVRRAVLAHAQAVVDAQRKAASDDTPEQVVPRRGASNQERWKLRALASVAVLGLAGLLSLQFDRGTPAQQELVRGQPSPLPAAVPESPATRPIAPLPAPPAPDATRGAEGAPAVGRSKAGAGTRNGSPPSSAQARKETAADAQPAPVAEAAASVQTEPAPAAPQAQAPANATAPAPPQPDRAGDADREQRRRDLVQALRPRAAAPVPPAQGMVAPQAPSAAGALAAAAPDLASALQRAVRDGRIADVDSLLAQGVSVDALDGEGRPPLVVAVLAGRADMVRHLLAAGANTALRDRDGQSALQHARRLDRGDLVQLLEAPR